MPCVIWSARYEMAPTVARILAREFGRDKSWQKEQIKEFTELAKGYYLED